MQPGKAPFDLPNACERQNQPRSLKQGRLRPQEWGAKQNLLLEQLLAVMSLSAMMHSGVYPLVFFRVASASFTSEGAAASVWIAIGKSMSVASAMILQPLCSWSRQRRRPFWPHRSWCLRNILKDRVLPPCESVAKPCSTAPIRLLCAKLENAATL